MNLENRSLMRINNKTKGKTYYAEELVITFLRDEIDKPRFLGTGFLISNIGLFITAKHVLIDNGTFDNKVFALTFSNEGNPIQSKIAYWCYHNDFDIMIGLIEPIESTNLIIQESYDIQFPGFHFDKNNLFGNVFTYAFPKSEIVKLSDSNVGMKYVPCLYYGVIDEYLELMPLVKCSGYQCKMPIEPGCSGGPVFHESGNIIGVNSASFQFDEISEPVMFATDIRYIQALYLENVELPNDKFYPRITIAELRKKGFLP